MHSKYIVQNTGKSFCPKCDAKVNLLCREDGEMRGWPWFYICFPCKLIAEVGKGEVASRMDVPLDTGI